MLPSNRVIALAFVAVLCLLVVPQYFVRKLHSVNGGYTEWSPWSTCLKDCGDSMQGNWYTMYEDFIASIGKYPCFKGCIHIKRISHYHDSNLH